jgi:hypothetical protein
LSKLRGLSLTTFSRKMLAFTLVKSTLI